MTVREIFGEIMILEVSRSDGRGGVTSGGCLIKKYNNNDTDFSILD